MPRPRKNRPKLQNIRTWLRNRTSPYCFGVKTRAGTPAHCNKNDDIKYHFASLKSGWYGRRLSRLKNKDMSDHFAGKRTFYFTADGRSATPEVLINIDIDCHNSGSLAGAIAFAEYLKATRFPNLYYEASTNGNGVHGYVIVVKGDLGDEGLNAALSILNRWLKAELARGKFDVEAVEVKGQAPGFSWGMKKFELKTYKSGQLAKLPREALNRADELRGTTRISVDELRKLYIPQAKPESTDSVVHRDKKAARKTSVVSGEKENKRANKTSVVSGGAEKKGAGSISGHHFGEDELSKLGGSYLSLARELIGETKLVATGRKLVTEDDLAVFFMLLKFFMNNINADGSLPVARWREMWTALFGAENVGRAWCHHRFARMRNYLSNEGWLSWQDEDFVVGVYDDDGRFIPGKAAKWKAGEELRARLEAVVVQEAGLGEGVEILVNDEVKEREEGESILYGHSQHPQYSEQPVDNQNNHNQTVKIAKSPNPNPESRQSTSFQDLLDDFGLWVPLPRPRFAGYITGTYRMAA